MCREPKPLKDPDPPFRWIILIPFDGVSVIHGKLMMEIVVALSKSYDCGYEVIAWGMFVIVRSLPYPMSERVDAKDGLRDTNNDNVSIFWGQSSS